MYPHSSRASRAGYVNKGKPAMEYFNCDDLTFCCVCWGGGGNQVRRLVGGPLRAPPTSHSDEGKVLLSFWIFFRQVITTPRESCTEAGVDPGGGVRGVRTPFLAHVVGFLTLDLKLDPLLDPPYFACRPIMDPLFKNPGIVPARHACVWLPTGYLP